MRSAIKFPLVLFVVTLLCFAGSSAAQQVRFEDFSSIANLQLNGSSHQATWLSQKVLRLTDGPFWPFGPPQVASSYFQVKQPIASGFTTWFEFQMHNPTTCCAPGDGVAFIIQNSTATDGTMGATGAGLTALGAGRGGIGYAGINNSLVVEFDILGNPWDPNSNHVAVQSCGQSFNTPVHLPGDYTIGNNHHVESCLLFQSQQSINTTIPMLGGACTTRICQNGPVNTVVIEYAPPTGNGNSGTLSIWLNPPLMEGTHTPKPGTPTVVPPIAYTINDPGYGLALDTSQCQPGQRNCGAGWVGFSADQPSNGTTQDILAWEFTPHVATLITKQIQNGGTPTTFPFGGHEADVTYPAGFQNCNPNCIFMNVLATPWNQATFFKQRLLGTGFANEVCVTYLQTGGNCIVYSVTCQDQSGPVMCPTEPPDNEILIQSSFTTTDPISPTKADFLEGEPIGSNNWFSIFTSYNPNDYDGVVSGKGQGFSDLVATFQRNKP